MRVLILLILTAWFVSCTTKSEIKSETTEDTVAVQASTLGGTDSFYSGGFEYSETWKEGYLYYKIELKQVGDSIKGTLLAGNYLAESAGGYSNPNTLMTCDVRGKLIGENVKLVLSVTDNQILEEGAPNLLNILGIQEDANTDPLPTEWVFMNKNGVLSSSYTIAATSEGGQDTITELEWEKIQ